MNWELNKDLADALVADRLREAEGARRPRATAPEMVERTDAVTVRLASRGDAGALARLSQLEGRPAPKGSTLVAEVGGVVLAARSLEDGAAVADPFRPTTQLAELLALRAQHLRNADETSLRPRRRLRHWLSRAARPAPKSSR
jgi:hypothetical protein